mgnify:CR=1 FL=1
MSPRTNRFCPYCLSALIGVVILMGIPQLADVTTPFGKASLLLFWIPLLSACIRTAIRHAAVAHLRRR